MHAYLFTGRAPHAHSGVCASSTQQDGAHMCGLDQRRTIYDKPFLLERTVLVARHPGLPTGFPQHCPQNHTPSRKTPAPMSTLRTRRVRMGARATGTGLTDCRGVTGRRSTRHGADSQAPATTRHKVHQACDDACVANMLYQVPRTMPSAPQPGSSLACPQHCRSTMARARTGLPGVPGCSAG